MLFLDTVGIETGPEYLFVFNDEVYSLGTTDKILAMKKAREIVINQIKIKE